RNHHTYTNPVRRTGGCPMLSNLHQSVRSGAARLRRLRKRRNPARRMRLVFRARFPIESPFLTDQQTHASAEPDASRSKRSRSSRSKRYWAAQKRQTVSASPCSSSREIGRAHV